MIVHLVQSSFLFANCCILQGIFLLFSYIFSLTAALPVLETQAILLQERCCDFFYWKSTGRRFVSRCKENQTRRLAKMAVLGIQNCDNCMWGVTVLGGRFLLFFCQIVIVFNLLFGYQSCLRYTDKLLSICQNKMVDCVHIVPLDLICKECNIFNIS